MNVIVHIKLELWEVRHRTVTLYEVFYDVLGGEFSEGYEAD